MVATKADSPSMAPRSTALSDLATDRKSTRLNSSHGYISYAVFCLKKKKATSPEPMRSSAAEHSRCCGADASDAAVVSWNFCPNLGGSEGVLHVACARVEGQE